MITALGGTVAPFAQAEKPQVFPRPATSFIKNSHAISVLGAIGGRRCRERRLFPERHRRYGYACFDWYFCDHLTQRDRASRLSLSMSAALAVVGMTLLIFTSGQMQQFRFGLNRHKYAT
jgi:hypothetical protein